ARGAGDVPAVGGGGDPEPAPRVPRAGVRLVLGLLHAVLPGGDVRRPRRGGRVVRARHRGGGPAARGGPTATAGPGSRAVPPVDLSRPPVDHTVPWTKYQRKMAATTYRSGWTSFHRPRRTATIT